MGNDCKCIVSKFDELVSRYISKFWFKTLSSCDYVEVQVSDNQVFVNFVEKTDYNNKYFPKNLWQKEVFLDEVFEHSRKMWGSALA